MPLQRSVYVFKLCSGTPWHIFVSIVRGSCVSFSSLFLGVVAGVFFLYRYCCYFYSILLIDEQSAWSFVGLLDWKDSLNYILRIELSRHKKIGNPQLILIEWSICIVMWIYDKRNTMQHLNSLKMSTSHNQYTQKSMCFTHNFFVANRKIYESIVKKRKVGTLFGIFVFQQNEYFWVVSSSIMRFLALVNPRRPTTNDNINWNFYILSEQKRQKLCYWVDRMEFESIWNVSTPMKLNSDKI